MAFVDPCPKHCDTDNVLLFKIAQILCQSAVISGGAVSGGGAVTVEGTGAGGTVPVAVASETGAANIFASQAVTSTVPALVLNSRLTRKSVTVKNLDTAITIYIGHDATVSSLNGMELKAGESIAIDTTAGIFAVSASGTPRLAFLEEFN